MRKPAARHPSVATPDAVAAPKAPDPVTVALAAAGIGIWQWDPAGGSFAVSPICQAHFGTASDLFEAIHPDDREMCVAALESGAGFDIWFRVETGAETRWIEMRGCAVAGHNARCVAGVTLDVTEHCRAAAEAGSLLAGFANQIGRPLAAAHDYLGTATRFAGEDVSAEDVAAMMAQADAQLVRLKDIMQHGVSAVISPR